MTSPHGGVEASGPPDLKRYLPLSVAVTALVVIVPALAVSLVEPKDDPAILLLSVPLAMGLSVAGAAVLSALWTRQRGSVDLVFGELMLWGWLRRVRAEKRLSEAATLLKPSGRSGRHAPAADVDQVEMLRGLIRLLEQRDPYTHGHSRRVTGHCERIARQMGLSAVEVAKIRTAASVHDIGKIQTPTRVLHRPGKLTEDELSLIRRHVIDGATLVAAMGDPEVTEIVRHHHERFDGSGYPDGISAEEIPLGARIIGVADAFDAMTSDRSYRKALSHRQALDELDKESGRQFDPAVVSTFHGHYSSERSIAWFSFAAAAPQRMLAWGGSLFEVGSGAVAGIGGAAQGAAAAGLAALLGLSMGGDLKAPPRSEQPINSAEVVRQAQPDTGSPSPGSPDRRSQQPRGKDEGGRDKAARDTGGSPAAPAGDSGTPSANPPASGTPIPVDAPVESPLPETPPEIELPPVKPPVVNIPPVELPPVQPPPIRIPPIELPDLGTGPLELPGVEVGRWISSRHDAPRRAFLSARRAGARSLPVV